mgnify:CR=1 FL=1
MGTSLGRRTGALVRGLAGGRGVVGGLELLAPHLDAYRVDVSVFGLFTLPHLAPKDEELFKLFQRMHFAGAIAMTLLVLLHIAGAVKHTLVNKDIVLWRMLPKSWGG